MKKPKMTKQERKIHDLERLLQRRERDIVKLNKYWAEEVARVERKNKFTRFQLDSIKKGEWPL
jgi:hypothetical protein